MFSTASWGTIPASMLVVGATYDVSVIVTFLAGNSRVQPSSNMLVEVRSLEEVCIGCSLTLAVAGGSPRVVGVDSSFRLDPLAQDLDNVDPTFAPFAFSWSCSTNTGAPCTSLLDDEVLDLTQYTDSASGSLTLPSGSLDVGNYTFVGTVSKGLPWHVEPRHYRNTSVVVVVVVRAAPSLDVFILQPATQPLTVTPGQGVPLLGAVGVGVADAAPSVVWALYSASVGAAPALYPIDPTTFVFVRVPANPAAGAAYVFAFTATGADPASTTVARAILVVNGPPTGGVVTVSATRATALVTPITVATAGWTDSVHWQVRCLSGTGAC